MINPNDFKKPIALPGDAVSVHNYKKKYKDDNGDMVDAGVWEEGKVTHTETVWYKDGTYSHKYAVFLNRQVQVPNRSWKRGLKLYVSEEQIKLLPY